MDIVNLLGTLKDTALDVKHIELLKHAYQLQEDNIAQLKTSNEMFRENANFLRRQNQEQAAQIAELMHTANELAQQLQSAQYAMARQNEELPSACVDIIRIIANEPTKQWCSDEFCDSLKKPRTAVDHYVDVLSGGSYILTNYDQTRQANWISLTHRGREYAVKHNLL